MAVRRFKLTLEITVSKLLPAGVGWQAMGTLASSLGVSSSSASFALLTGIGDGFGVALGHMIYKTCQRAIVRSTNKKRSPQEQLEEPSLSAELQTGIYLGSAAFCSGTVWQPVVNILTEIFPNDFYSTMSGTGMICAGVFFAGLRSGRILYGSSGLLPAIAPNSVQNLKSDAFLSVSIGGGSAAFVGTDYNMIGNPFRSLLGITPTDTALMGCIRAGASTALGFLTLQTGQNLALPIGLNYLDVSAFETPKVTITEEEKETSSETDISSERASEKDILEREISEIETNKKENESVVTSL